MPRLLNKFILSVLASLIVLFSFGNFFEAKADSPAPSAPPENTWYNQSFNGWYSKVYDTNTPSEIFGERYTAAQVQWVIYSLMAFMLNASLGNSTQSQNAVGCFLTGSSDVASCIKLLPSISEIPGKSLVQVPSQSLAQMVFADRPISGIAYTRKLVQKFNPVTEVHAQTAGFGFDALQPVQDMWKAFRDVSFGLFVIIAIVFAFMIMFRIKLSPQLVISVQSALPKIITSLILVTFSYAIAGFLIDFMYIIIGLISLIASRVGTYGLAAGNVFNFLTLGNPMGWNIQSGVIGLLALYILIFFFSFIILYFGNTLTMLSTIGGTSIPFLSDGVKGIILFLGILFTVIVIVVAIWNGFKTIVALLKAFVNVILLTIFAPLQLAFGALIPSMDFGSWVKSYLSNLSVFIVTGVLFLLSFMFLGYGVVIGLKGLGAEIFADGIWKIILGGNAPNFGPLPPNSWPPLLAVGGGTGAGGGSWIGLLFLVVSFVIFTMIPKATEIVAALIAGKPFAYGSAIGEAIGAARWAGGQAWSQTGARDIWELGQVARKSRVMEGLVGENAPYRPYLERFVGGGHNDASTAISNAQKKYKETAGRSSSV